MENDVVSDLKREYINRMLAERKRLDGRAPDEIRPVDVQTGIVTSAAGSARVKWGDTDVLVGVMVGTVVDVLVGTVVGVNVGVLVGAVVGVMVGVAVGGTGVGVLM